MQLQQSSSSSSHSPIRAVKEKGFYGILYKEAGRTMTHSAPLSCWSKCTTLFHLQLECMYGIVMLFYCVQYWKRPSWYNVSRKSKPVPRTKYFESLVCVGHLLSRIVYVSCQTTLFYDQQILVWSIFHAYYIYIYIYILVLESWI